MTQSPYLKDFDTTALKPKYPADRRRPSSDKYNPEVISKVICEVDQYIDPQRITRLRQQAARADYSLYYELLYLAEASDCDDCRWFENLFGFLKNDIFGCVFHKMFPDQTIRPHVDPIRGTSIYLPLFLKGEDYAPLEIYYDDQIFSVGANDNRSIYVWNTNRLHAVFNRSQNERYNLQLLVNRPYNEVLQKIQSQLSGL